MISVDVEKVSLTMTESPRLPNFVSPDTISVQRLPPLCIVSMTTPKTISSSFPSFWRSLPVQCFLRRNRSNTPNRWASCAVHCSHGGVSHGLGNVAGGQCGFPRGQDSGGGVQQQAGPAALPL